MDSLLENLEEFEKWLYKQSELYPKSSDIVRIINKFKELKLNSIN